MADEFIKVGSTFDVTLDCSPLTGVNGYSNQRIYYRRPDGKTGYLTPTSLTNTAMVGRVTPTENPIPTAANRAKAGAWQFYPYLTGSGTITYRGKEAVLVVHPEFRSGV